jgi:tetratricopeptide (TPR) repeat protein
MSFFPARHSKSVTTYDYLHVLALLLIVVWPALALAQGSGRSTQGTSGSHVITGYVFFPSGRRAEGNIQVKLQSLNAGELSVIADSSGSFTFSSLSPGNYTVVVIAGDQYEIGREAVFVDSDLDLSRMNVPVIKTSRRYTVMVTLQLKHHSASNSKGSVVNAALAEVPEMARTLYEKGVEQARAGDSMKAIDNLKAAVSFYPTFPLALNELGVQFLKVNQPHKAIGPLRSAAKLSPDAFLPKLNLGIALLETHQHAEAETQLRAALKQNDSAPTAHLYLGVVLTKFRNYVDAEKELRRAIDLGGNQLGLAHKYLGGIYWGRREYRLAVEELETYLRLTPNAQDAERVRGTIMELRSALSKPETQ